jgi:hypothetical protein
MINRPVWALVAALAFALALILHIIGHSAAKLVLDFELIGFLCVALHLAFGGGLWMRRQAVQQP